MTSHPSLAGIAERKSTSLPMIPNQNFGQAIEALKEGKIVSRAGWNGKGLFVFRQVPSSVPAEIIPKMTSLPQAAKDRLGRTCLPITYQNQFCIVYPDNSLHGWQPSGSDALATDWEIHDGYIVASETVGTATPL
jgi:hypothetical protein